MARVGSVVRWLVGWAVDRCMFSEVGCLTVVPVPAVVGIGLTWRLSSKNGINVLSLTAPFAWFVEYNINKLCIQ